MIATSGFIRRKATDAGRRLHFAPAPGPLAQLVEQGTLNPKVAGSIPARPTWFAGCFCEPVARRRRVRVPDEYRTLADAFPPRDARSGFLSTIGHARGRNRTSMRFRKPLLYPLSYGDSAEWCQQPPVVSGAARPSGPQFGLRARVCEAVRCVRWPSELGRVSLSRPGARANPGSDGVEAAETA